MDKDDNACKYVQLMQVHNCTHSKEGAHRRRSGRHAWFTCHFILLGSLFLSLPPCLIRTLLSFTHTLWPVLDDKMGMINCTEMSAQNNGCNVITERAWSTEKQVRQRGRERWWKKWHIIGIQWVLVLCVYIHNSVHAEVSILQQPHLCVLNNSCTHTHEKQMTSLKYSIHLHLILHYIFVTVIVRIVEC